MTRNTAGRRRHWASISHFVLAGLIALMSENAGAQALYGSLVGNVVDGSGGRIPGATVTATRKETNQTTEQTTPENGTYSFSNLLPGTYDVVVTLPGFQDICRDATLPSISAPSSASTRGSRLGTLEESVR